MSNSLKDSIRSHMKQLTNDQLREIWAENDCEEYSDEAFEVISEILQARSDSDEIIPPQIEQTDVDEYKESFIVVLLRVIAVVTIIAGVLLSIISYDASLGLCIVALVWSFIAVVFQLGFAEIISLLNKIYWKMK